MFQSGLGLPDRDYYLKDSEKFEKIRQPYFDYVAQSLGKVGVEKPGEAARGILELETKLAEAQWTRVESRDATKTYNKMTIAEFNQLMPSFDAAALLQNLGLNTDEIIVSQPSFFEELSEVMANTDLKVWQDYLTFRFTNDYAELLSDDMVDLKFGFFGKTLKGIEEQAPTWKKAVDASNSVLGEMLGKIYVKEYFPPEAKARMEELVDNLIKGFDQAIDGLEWMSAETKVAAKEKLNKFTPKIGYPDKWKDYSSLEINPDDLVGNYIRYSRFANQEMADKLGKPVDRSEWFMTPQTVNAFLQPSEQRDRFPSGDFTTAIL